MIYLLDTNVCISYLRGKDALLMHRVNAHQPNDIVLCSVVVAELCYGASLSNQPLVQQTNVKVFAQPYASLPFDDAAAAVFGSLRARLKILGTPIGPFDLMIAAIALTKQLTLVTNNTTEFSRVPGLPLEDWQSP